MPRRRRPPRAGALSELQPVKIATQIATLQALFYAAAVVLMLFTALVAGMPFSLDLVFGWDRVRGDTTRGWLLALIWVLDGGLCMAVAIVVLVARSKLVPDFALTVHFLHLVLTTLYSRVLPRNYMWWIAMLASAAVAVSFGMWGCRYRELQPVFFGGGRILGSRAAAAEQGENAPPLDADDADPGFASGSGRGRGPDGAGAYEMVHMKQAT
ncbi:integral membrane protein S linking to the trans golgi network domain-containing protein [Hirsutella rhossiliensis]|uniref:Integral membrane protein S linking to the trans golgi network domain-containing protein n=1 Tax=Hirsutella rhossiliensis TaxID=111463 RepID=A0A9P8N4R9_9HYPO|nr:integral membrane protein S linking to the trans golgi network domain-containing protein [Hirsutella rhossiliensis]KAH0964632.1 integral membrane protein S linking to the trans golgi network domain-containing protein [Hirsutella rhossiliensis]